MPESLEARTSIDHSTFIHIFRNVQKDYVTSAWMRLIDRDKNDNCLALSPPDIPLKIREHVTRDKGNMRHRETLMQALKARTQSAQKRGNYP